MKISLHQIPEGGTLHLEGEDDAAFLGLEEVSARALSPVRHILDVGLSEGGVFVTGSLHVRVLLTCVACLETFEYNLEIDPFAHQKELESAEIVDLTPEIREDIQLALPTYPRCDAEGGKTCPAHFPKASTEKVEPTAGPTAWEALDKLKNKD